MPAPVDPPLARHPPPAPYQHTASHLVARRRRGPRPVAGAERRRRRPRVSKRPNAPGPAPLRLRVLGARQAHASPASHLAARRRRGPRRVPGAWRRRWRPPGPSARTRRPPGRRRTCLNGLQPLIRAPHPSIVAAEPRRFPRRHSQIQPCTSSSARSCFPGSSR